MNRLIWSRRQQSQERDKHLRRSGEDYCWAFLGLLPVGQAWPREPGSTLWRVCCGLAQYWGWIDGRAADLLERESDPRFTTELLPDWERAWGLPDPCFPETQTLGERRKMLITKMTWLGGQSREYFERIMEWLGFKINIKEFAPFMAGVSQAGDTRQFATTRYELNADGVTWSPIEGDELKTVGFQVVLRDEDLTTQHSARYETLEEAEAAVQEITGNTSLTLNPVVDNWTFPVGASTLDVSRIRETRTSDNFRWYIGPPEMRFAWAANAGQMGLIWFRAGSGEAGVDHHLLFRPEQDLQCLLNRWKPAHTALVMSYENLLHGNPMEGTP